jgi:hypothetical protein
VPHRDWYECNTCRLRHPELAPGLAVYVCPHCSGTAITALPPEACAAVDSSSSSAAASVLAD